MSTANTWRCALLVTALVLTPLGAPRAQQSAPPAPAGKPSTRDLPRPEDLEPVSYTHLTLPTIYSV